MKNTAPVLVTEYAIFEKPSADSGNGPWIKILITDVIMIVPARRIVWNC